MVRERILKFNWRLALADILVNALSLGLTFLVLPGLYIVHPNKIMVLLLSGLIFGLLNAFIRPILQFALFNFLFATFGLVLVIINFILLAILGRLLSGWFEFSNWFALVMAAILVGLFGVVFDNLLGLSPPIVEHPVEDAPQHADHSVETRVEHFLEEDDSGVSAEGEADTATEESQPAIVAEDESAVTIDGDGK